MQAWLQRAFERFKAGSIRFGLAVQRVLVTILLTLLYVFGIGATKMLSFVFFRKHLQLYTTDKSAETFWKNAEGYGPDLEALKRQF
jgi:hypothetical protein